MIRRFIPTQGLFLFLCASVHAVDFEKEIKPILKENCFECHSEVRKKEKAGFVFDNSKRFAKDIGVNLNIEPGRPGSSHFFEVISNPDVKHAMPPDGPMKAADIEIIRKWIAEGAMLDANGPKPVFKKELPPIMKWTNTEGKSIKAGFERIEGDSVVLRMVNGPYVKFALSKLSAESQQLARECAAP
ncbi:hypothetical protein BH11VER1_BH11VER1_08450 [soil metagenome]